MLYFDKIMLYNVAVCVSLGKFIERERLKLMSFLKKAKEQAFLSFIELSRRKYSVLFYMLTVIYFEVIMQLRVFGELNWKIIFTVLFALPAGVFIVFLCNLFSKRINLIMSWVVLGFLYVYYCTQLIYEFVFGSLMSITSIKMGGDAVTNFYSEIFYGLWVNLPMELLFAVPLTAFGLLVKFRVISVRNTSRRFKLTSAIAYVLVHFVTVGMLFVGGSGPATAASVYFSNDADTDISARNLGMITTSRLELKNMLFGFGQSGVQLNAVDPNQFNVSSAPVEPTIDTSPNVIKGIDFNALNSLTDDEDLIELNNYFASQTGTNKNEYTGYFKGKNLIMMCLESFSPYFIDRERTPTLYKMVTGGFVFKNYYNSWPNTTTNGEYSLCMGMFPDMSRQKSDGSFKYSSDNYLPFAMGRQFESIGVKSFAYHNYLGSYYSRRTSHPNMGYSTFKTMGNGMSFTTAWPASDLEMMEQSVDDFINEEQFHAYYMTFSGHYRYSFESNPMCYRNRDAVADLEYSEAVRAYISCNLELEYALTYLFERLEEAGKLDDTVFVLASDHFPYGLTDGEYDELAGKEIDTTFDKFRSSFICYNSAMETVEVDAPCCNIDILPTISNLFGLEYDSRLIGGTDVLSTGSHMAILANKSFITNQVKYDAITGEVTYLVDESKVPDTYVDTMLQVVSNKFTISTEILNNDYYRFVFENTVGVKE